MTPTVTLTIPLQDAPTVLWALRLAERSTNQGGPVYLAVKQAGDMLQGAILQMEAIKADLERGGSGKTVGHISGGSGA